MKLIIKLVLASLLIAGAFYFANQDSTNVSALDKKELYKPADKPNLQQMVEGRGQHEFDMTHDPNTMTIPKQRLQAAFFLH